MNTIFNRFSLTALVLAGGLLIRCGEPNQDYRKDDDDRRGEAVVNDDGGETETSEGENSQNAYPRDEVREETNLDGDYLPMDLGETTSLIEKRKLLALLMRQKNDMEQRINELENQPGNPSNNTVVEGDIDKLRLYVEKLDLELVKVRKSPAGSMKEVSESALGAVKGAGALMQSSVMRIDRGF